MGGLCPVAFTEHSPPVTLPEPLCCSSSRSPQNKRDQLWPRAAQSLLWQRIQPPSRCLPLCHPRPDPPRSGRRGKPAPAAVVQRKTQRAAACWEETALQHLHDVPHTMRGTALQH